MALWRRRDGNTSPRRFRCGRNTTPRWASSCGSSISNFNRDELEKKVAMIQGIQDKCPRGSEPDEQRAQDRALACWVGSPRCTTSACRESKSHPARGDGNRVPHVSTAGHLKSIPPPLPSDDGFTVAGWTPPPPPSRGRKSGSRLSRRRCSKRARDDPSAATSTGEYGRVREAGNYGRVRGEYGGSQRLPRSRRTAA